VKDFYLVNFKNNISFLANYQLIKKSCNIYRKESWTDFWEFFFGMVGNLEALGEILKFSDFSNFSDFQNFSENSFIKNYSKILEIWLLAKGQLKRTKLLN
jgi:hypothetical protein